MVFNTILWWYSIVAYFFGPPIIPVKRAALLGVQVDAAAYHWVKRLPSAAIWSTAPGSCVGWPNTDRSPQPRSSTTNITMLGGRDARLSDPAAAKFQQTTASSDASCIVTCSFWVNADYLPVNDCFSSRFRAIARTNHELTAQGPTFFPGCGFPRPNEWGVVTATLQTAVRVSGGFSDRCASGESLSSSIGLLLLLFFITPI